LLIPSVSNAMDVFWFILFDICTLSFSLTSKMTLKHLELKTSHFTCPRQFYWIGLTIPV
jgi:hypothetical protein